MIKRLMNLKREKRNRIVNRPTFLKRLAILLEEGYTFHDSLLLLVPHHCKEYELVEQKLTADFKEGFGATHILAGLGFSSASLLPIAIAEIDGRLSHALIGMAKRLQNKEEKQKKLKNILLYPMVLLIFLTVLLLAFRRFFLPNMESLAMSQHANAKGIVSLLPLIVTKIPDVLFGLIIGSIALFAICMIYYKKSAPERKIVLYMKIPIINSFFSMMKTRDFSCELGSLLQSGLSMQDALDVLINQQQDDVIGEIAKQIKARVVFGEDFSAAVQMTDGLTKTFSAFAKHGENSGHLSKELMIYSDQLNETIDEKLSKWMEMLQPALFTIIALCILGAYLTLLLPVYGMMDKI